MYLLEAKLKGEKSFRAVKHKDIKLLEVWKYMLEIWLVCPFLSIHSAGLRGARIGEPLVSCCVEGPHGPVHV